MRRVNDSREPRPDAWRAAMLLALVWCAVASAWPVAAATITVVNTNDSGAGSLRQAIADAASGDAIDFNLPGSGPWTITLSSQLDIGKNLTIKGPGTELLTVSGNNSCTVFYISNGTSSAISGITVADGKAGSVGGGIFNAGSLTVSGCTIEGNSTSGRGGGVINTGTLAITGCTIQGNSAAVGGGAIYNASTLTITGSTVSGNSCSYTGYGGGICNDGAGSLTSANCTFTGNSATVGAGLFNEGGAAAALTNCTFSGNSGSAAIIADGPVTLADCTIAWNHAPAGLSVSAGSTCTLKNTVVASNYSPYGQTRVTDVSVDGAGTLVSSGYNVIGWLEGGTGSMQPTDLYSTDGSLDAKLGPLADNGGPTQTCALLPGSPAIDLVAAPGTAPATDQRGYSRVGLPDSGAYEYNAKTRTVVNTNDSGFGSLRQAILDASDGDAIGFDVAGSPSPWTITLTTGTLVVDKSLTIAGPGAGLLTVSGGGACLVVSITAGTSTIAGVTVANGHYSVYGGGLYIGPGASVTIDRCLITQNVSNQSGGGIYNAGTLAVTDSVISENQVPDPHGRGGGIFNTGTLSVSGSTISGNRPDRVPGEAEGVAVHTSGSAAFTNCTIYGNSGSLWGAIAARWGSSLSLTNCTVAGNSGAVMGVEAGLTVFSSCSLKNTIFAGSLDFINNPAPDIRVATGGTLNSDGYNVIGYMSAGGGAVDLRPTDILGTAPGPADAMLGPLADNGGPTQTCALLPGSPAIDLVAAPGTAPATDQRGYSRRGLPDSGAYEYPSSATTKAATNVTSTGATLNGTVNPYGEPIDLVRFEYGLTTAYELEQANLPQSPLLTGSSDTDFSRDASLQLTPNTTYHYRVSARYTGNTVATGFDSTFTTLPTPTAVTGPAFGVSLTGATLSGTVNPGGGQIDNVRWEYGPDTSYGHAVDQPRSPALGGSSDTPVECVLSGVLSPGATVHYRVKALFNGGLLATGADRTFTAQACPATDAWGSVNDTTQIQCLAVGPSTSPVLYAGTGGGHVLASADRGCKWAGVDLDAEGGVSAVAAAGTGQVAYAAAPSGAGVFRSTDGGATWTKATGAKLNSHNLTSLALNPSDPSWVYLGTSDKGVYKSTDGGGSWTQVFSAFSRVTALAAAPSAPLVVYAGTYGGGVYKTTDGGSVWTQAATGLKSFKVASLAVDPIDSAVVYAGLWEQGGVNKSTDGGSSWSWLSLSSDSVRALAVDSTNPAVVYAGLQNAQAVYRSTDGGASFTPYGLSGDVYALAADPEARSAVYAGLLTGVCRRVSAEVAGADSTCAGTSVTLDAGPGHAAYLWSPGGATTQAVTVSPASTATYSVTTYDSCGCATATASHLLTVNPLPAPTISGPASVCAGSSATLDAGAGFSTYLWSTGAATRTITVAPPVTTSYTVAVTNASGCSATSAVYTVTVNAIPTPSISGPASVCAGSSVTLDAGAGFSTYLWSPGGATTKTVSVSPSTTTAYTVAVTNASGCSATSAVYTVTVNAAPAPAITGPASVCAGSSVTLDAGAGFSTYLWSPGGATTKTVSVSPAETTAYTVAVTNASGCSATSAGHTVTVNAAPAPAITGPASVCAGSSVTLDAGAGFSTYLWSPGGATTKTVSVSPSTTTAYTVAVTNASGCSATSAVYTVTVNAAPSPAITGPASVCAGSSVTLDAGAVFSSYLWSPGGATTKTVSVSPATTTVYTVAVTNGSGCSATSAGHTLTVNALPTPSISGPASVCAGSSVTLDAGAGFSTYLWSTGAATRTIEVAPPSTAAYTVTVTDGSGCSATSAAHAVAVKVSPNIQADPLSTEVCPGGSATLTVAATGAEPLTYAWFQGASPDQTTPAPGGANSPSYTTPELAATTQYWVRVSNACGSANSAAATVGVTRAPAILVNPAGATVCSGGSATLTVTASRPVVNYQWYKGAEGDVSTPVGANSAKLVTGTLTYPATFWVRVTGECGMHNDSPTAEVAVFHQPRWDVNPTGAKVRTGGTAVLSAEAEGGGVEYQWYQGETGDAGHPVEGATGPEMVTPPVYVASKFWCRATNMCGSEDSEAAEVVVENTFIVCHSAETADWMTEFRVSNPYAQAAPVRFDAYGADGALLDSTTVGGPPAWGARAWKPSDLFSAATLAKDHWVKVVSSADVRVLVEYRTSDGRSRTAVSAAVEGSTGLVYPYVVTGAGEWYSGVVVVNDGADTAQARVEGFDTSGAKLGDVTVAIPPKGKKSWLLDQVFGPGVDAAKIRSLRAASDQPLAGLELFGNWTWKGVAAAAAVPWATGVPQAANPAAGSGATPPEDAYEMLYSSLLFAENQAGGGRSTGLSVTAADSGGRVEARAYGASGALTADADVSLGAWAQQTGEAGEWFGPEAAAGSAYYTATSTADLEGFQMVYSDEGQAVKVFSGLPGAHALVSRYALPDARADASRKASLRLTNPYRSRSPFPQPPVNSTVTVFDAEGAALASATYALENGCQTTVDLVALLGDQASKAAWALVVGDGFFLVHAAVEGASGSWLTLYMGIPAPYHP